MKTQLPISKDEAGLDDEELEAPFVIPPLPVVPDNPNELSDEALQLVIDNNQKQLLELLTAKSYPHTKEIIVNLLTKKLDDVVWNIAAHPEEQQKKDLFVVDWFVNRLRGIGIEVPYCWFCHPEMVTALLRHCAWERQNLLNGSLAGEEAVRWLNSIREEPTIKQGTCDAHDRAGAGSHEISNQVPTPKSVREFIDSPEFAYLFIPKKEGRKELTPAHPASDQEDL